MLIVKDANRSLQISMDFPSRMTLLSLNHDTVERLISFLPSSDALRLSMTAHGLHQIAKRRALAEVRLRTTERSTLFCKYMLADIMDRLQHLRQLEIHLGTFYEERISLAIPGLVRVLAHAPALQSLTLDDAEVMLESGILAAAVRMLTTLEELNLRKYGLLSVSTVRRLSSNLRKLSLTGMLLPRRHVALSMLLCPDPDALTDDDQAAKRWPSITELELDVACPMDTIPHKAIVQSFPNLQCLLLRVTEADIAEGEERPTRVPDRVGWPHLDWLTGTPVSLGGFTGPVKCLRFTEGAPDVLHERGAEIVGYLRPVFLSVAAPHESDTRFWTQLGEHAHRLRSLRIELINPGKDASELDEWMAHVPAALSGMDLVCLGISIVDHQAGALFYPTAEAVALELAKRIPALRYIYLHIGARAGDSEWAGRVAWWRAAGAGGLRKLQRVTSGLGTCVEQYLTSTNFEESQELDDPCLFPDEEL